jgi:leucyl/phenylalanyl-tRNA--protein transferase
MSALPWLDPYNDDQPFPNPEYALTDPDGLLAVGGNLSPKRLLRAYRHGIFPWYSEGQPILWWSPDPRTVLFPERIKISRSLRKTMRKEIFTVTLDHAFEQVIQRVGVSPVRMRGLFEMGGIGRESIGCDRAVRHRDT